MSAKHLFTFLAGAVAGAAAVCFLTSEKGKETVENFRREAGARLDELENAVEDVKAKAGAVVRAAADTVKEAADSCR